MRQRFVNRCSLDGWFSPDVPSGWSGGSISQLPPSTSYYLVPKLFSLDNTTSLLPSRTESFVLSCSSGERARDSKEALHSGSVLLVIVPVPVRFRVNCYCSTPHLISLKRFFLLSRSLLINQKVISLI